MDGSLIEAKFTICGCTLLYPFKTFDGLYQQQWVSVLAALIYEPLNDRHITNHKYFHYSVDQGSYTCCKLKLQDFLGVWRTTISQNANNFALHIAYFVIKPNILYH